MTTDQKGAVADAAVALAAIKLGAHVYRPISDSGRADLILDIASKLFRVQCKWVPLRGGWIPIPFQSCRRGPEGFVRRVYTVDEIDALVAYCQALDRCFWLPIQRFAASPAIRLRLAPSRNNQRLRINWADDFDFAARLSDLGAVAQLGEH